MSLRDRLLQGDAGIAVWGGGYIGASDAAFYAKHGVRSLIVELDSVKVDKINSGEMPYPDMTSWLGFDTKPLQKMFSATLDWYEALSPDYPVHLVCVNTEKDGKICSDFLADVAGKIAKTETKPLIIVESTLAPGWVDRVVRPKMRGSRIAVAPRRDWFTILGRNIETLDRVVGATSPRVLKDAVEVLSIVSSKIHKASSYRIAELVKCVENAYRYVEISLAYQLTFAYPSIDIREVLKLCGTKWNLETFYPNLGVAGYCIPESAKYVLSGAEFESELTLLVAAQEADRKMVHMIVDHFRFKQIGHRVVILGLAYKGGLKVHIHSASVRLAKELHNSLGISPLINDPLYSDDEIREITGFEPARFPEGLKGCDCIVLATDHNEYKSCPKKCLYEALEGCKLILDCHGWWSNLADRFEKMGIEYHEIGDAGWLR